MKERLQVCGEQLDARRPALVQAAVAELFARRPDLDAASDPRRRQQVVQAMGFHLSHLCEAVRLGRPELFEDYAAWLKAHLTPIGIPEKDIADGLEALRESLVENIGGGPGGVIKDILAAGLRRLADPDAEPAMDRANRAPLSDLAAGYLGALLGGDRRAAGRLVLEAADRGTDLRDLYLGVFQPVQYEIGRLWQTNAISIAQEHYFSAATQLVMSQLYPRVFAGRKKGRTLVAASIAGELHEIGVRMVADFFELEGWDTYYLGANMPAEDVVREAGERRADVVGVSATMTFHLKAVEDLVRRLRAADGGHRVKILVGGYPFRVSPDLWQDVGADGSAADARGAVAEAERLIMGG
jgi:methanogenic corrinoid protein MtbC1